MIELRDTVRRVLLAIVVQVQLRIDPEKPYTWPLHVATLRARRRCPGYLLVVAPDTAVAAWAAVPWDRSCRVGRRFPS